MRLSRILILGAAVALLQPAVALAHCDALDGPVVQAARTALEGRNVTPVLRWVLPEREAEIRDAFDRTLRVRSLGAEAQKLADTWFFETLVRVHRAGEGEPFTGLKPAGETEPFVALVDATLEQGSLTDLMPKVNAHVARGVTERFERARALKGHADDSVEAARKYVAAYVDYLHHVEGIHRAAEGAGHGVARGAGGHDQPR
jgi:hypothetical protein